MGMQRDVHLMRKKLEFRSNRDAKNNIEEDDHSGVNEMEVELATLVWQLKGESFRLEAANKLAVELTGLIVDDPRHHSEGSFLERNPGILRNLETALKTRKSFRSTVSIESSNPGTIRNSSAVFAYLEPDRVAVTLEVPSPGQNSNVDSGAFEYYRQKELQRLINEKNTALKVVLDQYGAEKESLRRQIQNNIDTTLRPLITTLLTKIDPDFKSDVSLIIDTLDDLTASFAGELHLQYPNLTKRELQVCDLVKRDCLSKEIADLLGLSVRTIDKIRQRIRHKLAVPQGTRLGEFLSMSENGSE